MFAGSIAWYRGLAAGGIARVGQLNLAQPFLAIAWSGLLLGEHIPASALIAAAVVIAAMAICINSRDPATTPHPAPGGPHADPAANQPP